MLFLRKQGKTLFLVQDAFGDQGLQSKGVKSVVDQQFEIGSGSSQRLVPILEPVDINSSTKAEAEQMLLDLLIENIKGLDSSQKIMLSLACLTKIIIMLPVSSIRMWFEWWRFQEATLGKSQCQTIAKPRHDRQFQPCSDRGAFCWTVR